jgi:hypothetical protein
VTEGTCEPVACPDLACTELVISGSSLPSVPSTSPGEPLPDARCRFDVSTVEGESLDIVVSLDHIYRDTVCCCTGPGHPCNAALREYVAYSWAVSVNGVALGTNTVTLPATWTPASSDGGT